MVAKLEALGPLPDSAALGLLDAAASEVGDTPGADRGRRSGLLGTLARGYAGLGRQDRAEPLARQALDERLADAGSTEADLAAAEADLARILAAGTAADEAIGHFHRAILHRQRSTLGPDSTVARLRAELAWAFRAQGDYESAAAAFQEALEDQQASLGANHPYRALTLLGLATVEQVRGRTGDARLLADRALAGLDVGAAAVDPRLPLRARPVIAGLLPAIGKDREAAAFAAAPQRR
jgi:tetratricopeptide (TPR) repeat protein